MENDDEASELLRDLRRYSSDTEISLGLDRVYFTSIDNWQPTA